jgi:hypothetical protein
MLQYSTPALNETSEPARPLQRSPVTPSAFGKTALVWLPADTLLDAPVAPALACAECLLPYIWCCCQAREVLRG